jgi:uncharacterized protein CbrC (UPF0167 family)
VRPGYEGGYSGRELVDLVCESCLAGGRLAERGLTANELDIGRLRTQLGDTDAIEAMRAEVEERTPPLTTWQDWWWPVHCAAPCRFEQEVGRAELEALARGDDIDAFLEEHAYDDAPPWDAVAPAAPQRGEAYTLAVYLFRCTVCDRPVLVWDAD